MKSQIASSLARYLENEGIDNVLFIDMRKLVGYTDYMAVITCPNNKKARKLSHAVRDWAESNDMTARVESDKSGAWSVIDLGDIVVHLFSPLARDYYRLDKLWGMAPQEIIKAHKLAG